MADNTTLNAGSGGDVIATDDIGGVKYQRVKLAFGADGSAADVSDANPLPVATRGETFIWRWVVPPQAVGANKVMCDLFNATGSGVTLRVVSAWAFVNQDTAVTGTLGIRLHLTRTTSVGTGGTTTNADEATLTNSSLSRLDPSLASLPAQVTARVAPGGGAAAGAQLGTRFTFMEETNAGTAVSAALGLEFVRVTGADLLVPANTGIRFVQGAVASVGSVGFEVNFSVE